MHPVQLDLAHPHSIDEAFGTALAQAGHFDVVINNAGSGHFGPAESLSVPEITEQFQILCVGHVHLMQLALRAMHERGSGLIINVTSLASRLPVPFMAAYNAGKAAMAAYTMTTQLELGDAVRIVDLQPADISTDFNDAVTRTAAQDARLDAKVQKVWNAVERNMKAAPKADLVAQRVLEIIEADRSSAAHHRWRRVSIQNCAPDFSIPPPTRSHLGTQKILRDMNTVSEAVVLMAGSGSRLRGSRSSLPKPLTPILDRPLISYTIEALAKSGIAVLNAVVGFESESLIAGLRPLIPPQMQLRVIENPDWKKQNGISLLAAARHVTAPFLLSMSDHLFDQTIVDLLIETSDFNQINLAIDKKLDSIFDLDDAMKVQTRGDRIVAIGKNLATYDAIDTGLFVCPVDIFDYLERAKRDGDCSLADGVRLMAADDRVRGIDIGGAWWQDIDTLGMLANAERCLQLQARRNDAANVGAPFQPGDPGQK